GALQFEHRALDELPAQRTADGDAQILSADFARLQPLDAQPSDAARRRARCDADVFEAVAAEADGAKRAQQIRVAEVRGPCRRTLTRFVRLRRQVRWIVGAGPDVGRFLGV